jgi:RNA polymerase sigma-70 factor (ECF subfamily)
VDSAEFDEFYRATARRLVQYAYAMCGDLEGAQDLAQEAYVRAWQQWRRVRGYEHPESWLRLVVTRLSTDRWRRLGVHRRAMSAMRPPEHTSPPSESSVLLTVALRGIPAAQRRALVLHYLMDLPIADIATETGLPIGTVKAQLSRGRTRLAQVLGEQPVPAETERNDAS